MPILVSGNATREQIPSPGQRRVVDSVSRGVTQPKTGVRWSGVDCTENDTSAIPKTVYFIKIQIGHTLGYLNNREDVLKDFGENVPFFGNGEKAPLMIDFANHGGSRPGIIAFDEIDEQQSPTHPSSDKQRVLMHRHQGWNVRHGLCHIYMRYIYIYMSCL